MPLPLWAPQGEGTARCPRVLAQGQGCTGGHVGGVSGGAGICTMNFQVPASILPTTLHFNRTIPPPSVLCIHRLPNKTCPAWQHRLTKQIPEPSHAFAAKCNLSTRAALMPVLWARTKRVLPNCCRQRAALTKVEQWWQRKAALLRHRAHPFVLCLLQHNARPGSFLQAEHLL